MARRLDTPGPRLLRRRQLLAVYLSALAIVLAASSCTGAPARFEALQAIACPDTAPLLFVSIDESGTARGADLTTERRHVIEELLTAVAACGGSARVQLFSSSAAATRVLFTGDLKPVGATKNARLRRVPNLVAAAMKEIDAKWGGAITELPAGGTDVLSQLALAQEYRIQVGADRRASVVILSDGVQTTGVILNTPDLTKAVAADLASRVAVPTFGPLVHVMFAGLGKVNGPPPPTDFVDALKAFYRTACGRTGARCTVVTDFAGQEGW